MVLAVTGANGFVGRVLVPALVTRGHQVRALVRRDGAAESADQVERRVVPDLCDEIAVGAALAGANAVIHLAARAHVMNDTEADPDAAFRRANVEVTAAVLRAAEAAGVKRFVYVSSIKVNGERTTSEPFRASDAPAPSDPYARSKLAAEQLLARASAELEVCIVRPPLVYGEGVKGNLQRLLRLVQRGVPLPFRSIRNRRSLVSVHNLAAFLERCAVDPRAAGQTFLIADERPISTADLVTQLAAGMNRRPRLVPMPAVVLRLAASVARRQDVIERLIGSMEIDAGPSYQRLDWKPQVDTAAGLRAMAASYLDQAD